MQCPVAQWLKTRALDREVWGLSPSIGMCVLAKEVEQHQEGMGGEKVKGKSQEAGVEAE